MSNIGRAAALFLTLILLFSLVPSMEAGAIAKSEDGTTRVLIRVVFQEKKMMQAVAALKLVMVKDADGNEIPREQQPYRNIEIKNVRDWEGIFTLENGYWIIHDAYIVNDWKTDITGCMLEEFKCDGTPLTVYCPMAEWYWWGDPVVTPEKWVVEGMDTNDFWIWEYKYEWEIERSLLRTPKETTVPETTAAPDIDEDTSPVTINESDYQQYLDELFGRDTSVSTVVEQDPPETLSSETTDVKQTEDKQPNKDMPAQDNSGKTIAWIAIVAILILICLAAMGIVFFKRKK